MKINELLFLKNRLWLGQVTLNHALYPDLPPFYLLSHHIELNKLLAGLDNGTIQTKAREQGIRRAQLPKQM